MAATRKFGTGCAAVTLAFSLWACAGTPAASPLSGGAETQAAAAETEVSSFSEGGIAALEARMAQYVTDGQVKGIATRLVKDGKIVSEVRAGIRREEDGAPIEDDTIYRYYSMSKPITGVALMMLWEEGEFQLDDPVTKYIPELEGLQVYTGMDDAGQPILEPMNRPPTIQELMSHTAGFGYGLRGNDYVNEKFRELEVFRSPGMEGLIERVSSIPLLHQPGTVWDYSISVDLQGYLVEKLSGQKFGAFLKTRLFDPLGMKDTAFFVPDDQYDRFADLYLWDGKTWAPATDWPYQFREDTIRFEGGGHGLVGTMDDYARFTEMLVNEGTLDGIQILKPETVRLMATDHLPPGVHISHDGLATDQPTGVGFGLDFAVMLERDPAMPYPAGSYRWGGAAGTWFWVDPVNDLYFIGMIQHFGGAQGGFDGRSASVHLVYEALEEAE
ncbi:beta-lactamase family protein [Hyphomonas sp. WL0036]|uniref:serine hydrolase domain-containing protein n=1 Tax=Hyphomonas sediminis TaxID=2866160 RepID=UPI001C811371|nr:serine hydrolase domain-containing protein [Hyphomonas sediminis]MBY9068316.1 beta-lactamase family protein [Hyphomonas sediminis]